MEEILKKMVNGALRDTINCHGPITRQYIESASKRIVAGLLGYAKQKNLRLELAPLGQEATSVQN